MHVLTLRIEIQDMISGGVVYLVQCHLKLNDILNK